MIAQDQPVATTSASGQESAFEQLYLQTWGDLLAYLHRRTGGWGGGAAEAADLLAQVYLVAWRRREVAPPAGQQRPWLFGIARLVLAEHHRTSMAQVRLQEVTDEVTGQVIGACPGTVGDDRESVHGVSSREATIRRALHDLGDLDRELLLLTVWDGLSCGEAARALRINAGTARVRLHRARHRLRGHEELLGLLSEKA